MIKYNFLIFITAILIGSFGNINFSYGASCEYKGQIDQCIAADKKGNTKSIEDFVCITGTNEEIAYQVVLDLEFKKVDDKMDKYIENLEKNKNVYFGRDAQRTFIDGINDIHKKSSDFYKEYNQICGKTIIEKVMKCMPEGKTSITRAKTFFSDKGTPCKELINQKLDIYDDIAFGVLMLNKEQIKADEKKTYDQGQRRNYDNLLNIMMINIGYLERIWQKWPSKLANPHK